MTAKETTKPARKAPAKKTAAKHVEKKPAAPRKAVEHKATTKAEHKPAEPKAHKASGRYMFATGRRKTAVANIRLFNGTGNNMVNKKAFDAYFTQSDMRDNAVRPLALTGLIGDYYFVASVNGGGVNAQAAAVRHGIAQALATLNDDVRKVLKKNGFLTRDDRKKERKKPGLRRARRAPQWAKR